MSREVIAIHLTKLEGPDAKEDVGRLRRQWQDEVEPPAKSAGLTPPKLVISPSPYRSFAGRLLKHLAEVETEHSGRPLLVVIPEVVKEHWWDYILLDSSRTRRLRAALHLGGGAKTASAGNGGRGSRLATPICYLDRDPAMAESAIRKLERETKSSNRLPDWARMFYCNRDKSSTESSGWGTRIRT
jgi:hypothetical protein